MLIQTGHEPPEAATTATSSTSQPRHPASIRGVVQPEYVTSGVAAERLGVNVRSLQRWVREMEIEPHHLTPGGHARWDVDRLRRELIERGKRRRG